MQIRIRIKGNQDTFNFELLIFAKMNSIQGFRFGIEVVKNSEGACVFCIAVIGGASPPYKYGTKYTSPLRFFDTPSIHSNLLEMLQNCPQN